ncbi:coiled-coil domain-containing protein 130 homolog isoform X1 [Macrobrachium nipponense]|uniref:coiled-coil domain-containing protein 130 homolog isoform X1 n=1 Tax=Macrobrachium nipponense TaxID=159736 RepID=UPI0030C803F3
MGERKGVNKYYPPDYDPRKGGLNKFQGTHALRERARKLHMGILIIRFEMPYNIWCDGCENHIGTGVRYNAEKKKVGMYYSTPIYQFRMKCHLCDNHFEIKTDPANLDYEIVSGARRQERRWDPTDNEQIVPEDKEVTRKMAADAMFKLEHGVDDKKKSKANHASIEQLEEFQTRRWHDDYGANRAMRDMMRVKRTKEQEQATRDASYNLPVPLLPPDESDEKTAELLQLTQSQTSDELQKEKRSSVDAYSIFAKLKPKSVSTQEKKAFARQSVKNIVNSSQKNFTNFKNNFKPQTLGIKVKKTESETASSSVCGGNVEEHGSTSCKCKINSSLETSDVFSSPSVCGKCQGNTKDKGSSQSEMQKLKDKNPSPSVSGKFSVETDSPLNPQCSDAVDRSSHPEVGKSLSLVSYDSSESD